MMLLIDLVFSIRDERVKDIKNYIKGVKNICLN